MLVEIKGSKVITPKITFLVVNVRVEKTVAEYEKDTPKV